MIAFDKASENSFSWLSDILGISFESLLFYLRLIKIVVPPLYLKLVYLRNSNFVSDKSYHKATVNRKLVSAPLRPHLGRAGISLSLFII